MYSTLVLLKVHVQCMYMYLILRKEKNISFESVFLFVVHIMSFFGKISHFVNAALIWSQTILKQALQVNINYISVINQSFCYTKTA